MTRHNLFNPEGMTEAVGFSHGAIAAEGNTLYIAGQTGHHPDGSIDEGIVDQFGVACRAVGMVIEESGGEPADLVSLTIYTSDVQEYRANLSAIGVRYRDVFGKHFPPMALIGISELFDPAARVELVGVVVLPPTNRRG